MGVRDIARRVAEAKPNGGGNYLRDGSGVLILKLAKVDDMHNGETEVLEFIVENSKDEPGAKDEKDRPVLANPAGSEVSQIHQFDEYPDVAFKNSKGFWLALLNESDETLEVAAEATLAEKRKTDPAAKWTADDEFAELFVTVHGPTQPCAGMRIGYSTFRKNSKKKVSLVLPKWRTIEQDATMIADGLAKLKAATPTK